jgi:hypothetical protein
MPKIRIDLHGGQPLFDIASYARRGSGRRDRLTPGEVALVSRTTRRAPEVMVKVLTKGSADLASVRRHFGYIGRYGELALETDNGEQLQGRHIGRELLEDWDLDLEEHRRSGALSASFGRQPPKLVHKLMLSMPAGTPPKAVLAAARNFLREEFALQYRYAFLLHTDEPHPHVHVVVKAVSEQGTRLHIKKDTLRRWRQDFAHHLRELGIEANATERALRGVSKTTKHDAIYRATRRGDSSHVRDRLDALVREMAKGDIRAESGKAKLLQTRKAVTEGWQTMGAILVSEGRQELATDVQRFVEQMQPTRTEKEWMAQELLDHAREGRIQRMASPALGRDGRRLS